MIVVCPTCGRAIDDEFVTTACEEGDHYPLGTSKSSYCKHCDLFKPCLCDAEFGEAMKEAGP